MASPSTNAQAEDAQHTLAAPEESRLATEPMPSANSANDVDNDGDAVAEAGASTTTQPPTIPDDELEDGEVDGSSDIDDAATAPPLPDGGPPLPSEPVPDDGWECQLDPSTQAWFFYNRFTGKTQWDNPRVPAASSATAPSTTTTTPSAGPQPPSHEQPAAGGYNPAIHGDYDPDAWYAKGASAGDDEEEQQQQHGGLAAGRAADVYAATVAFNRHSGGFQTEEMGPGRHSNEAKARRQMNAYFDADSASASHDGRSLRAERQNKKPSKSEVKAFKEKRRARKEEKRRAWLRD